MTKRPLVVNENMPASKALAICSEKKITSLLVVSDKDFKSRNRKLRYNSYSLSFTKWDQMINKKRN